MKNRSLFHSIAAVLLMTAGPAAVADQLDELRALRDTTINLVRLLVQEGLISKEKADALIEQAEKAGAAAQAANATPGQPAEQPQGESKVVRVPYVPEIVKNELREEIKQEVLTQAKNERWGDPGTLPDWLNRISLSGDIRLRGEQDSFPDGSVPNAPPAIQQLFGTNINNTTEDTASMKLRLRLALQIKVADTVSAGARLATGGTGSGSNPVSTNQTLGSYGSRYTLGVDRAWITYAPASWFLVTGGRIANPYFAPTELVWDEDLNFEGVAARVMPKFNENVAAFATVGAFPIQYIEPTPTNAARTKWLYGYQAGLELNSYELGSLRMSTALYDYHRVEGTPDPDPSVDPRSNLYDLTAPQFRQKGNSAFYIDEFTHPTAPTLFGLASRFREVNFSGSLDIAYFDPYHVILDADYVRNIGFDENEIFRRTGLDLEPRTTGYQTRLAVGMPAMQKRGDWQGFIGYRYVQRDATLDAFTDSDFHLGGTDAKGYFLGGSVTFEKNTFVRLRWLSGKEIDNLPLSIDVLQLDLNTKF
ncbi:MAG TPA: putative porin [Burkholderiales bacterium]|nr:putative porin [Burkholderiales bacterium]